MDIPTTLPPPVTADRRTAMMAQAQGLEAAFLAEMLGHAGLGTARDGFGGGSGEEQFTSFLKQEQARMIVERGGIGLAQTIFNTMAGADDATSP